MKNYVQPGSTVTLAAPYAVASGDGLLVGSIFGVAAGTAANGEAVETALVGVFDASRSVALRRVGTILAQRSVRAHRHVGRGGVKPRRLLIGGHVRRSVRRVINTASQCHRQRQQHTQNDFLHRTSSLWVSTRNAARGTHHHKTF